MSYSGKKQDLKKIYRNLTDSEEKGLNAVVATTLLMGLSVAAAGSYFVLQESVGSDVKDNTDDFQSGIEYTIENCYIDDSTVLTVRNEDSERSMNTSRLETYVDGSPQDTSASKEMVGPQNTFEVVFEEDPEDSEIKIVRGRIQDSIHCRYPSALSADFELTPENPTPGEEITFNGSESFGDIETYEWDLNNNGDFDVEGKVVTNSYSEGNYQTTLKITDNEGEENTETKTFNVEYSSTASGAIYEGGGSTQTLTWGTNGDLSILANSVSSDNPSLCIGSNCQEDTDNDPLDSTEGDYANRDIAEVNGTVEVNEKITFSSGDLCIGSNCGDSSGDPDLSTQFYTEDNTLDGPLDLSINDETNSLIMNGTVCWGSNC